MVPHLGPGSVPAAGAGPAHANGWRGTIPDRAAAGTGTGSSASQPGCGGAGTGEAEAAGTEERRIMTRRGVFARIGAAILRIRTAFARPKRYSVPPTLWYETANGERWIPDERHFRELTNPPDGYEYQHCQIPNSLTHSICLVSGPSIATGSSTWPEDLVLAMAKDGYKLGDAILIAANMCERCLNAACHDYGLKWGYPRHSEPWKAVNTTCEFCGPAT